MKRQGIVHFAPIVVLGFAATSCGSETGHAAAPSAPNESRAEETSTLPPVPTPEEADRKAAAEVTPDNADAELEKLKKELEDG